MKMKKKYIVIGAIISSFLIFCYLTLLPHNTAYVMKLDDSQKNVKPVKSENNNSTDDFKNLFSFAIKIEEETLKLPMDLTAFLADGWESTKEIGDDPFSFVPIEHTEFYKNNTRVDVLIDATEIYPSTMDKYYVSSILIVDDYYANTHIELPKNIILHSSDKNAILEAYGNPDEVWNHEGEPEQLIYKYDKNQMIILALNDDEVLNEVMMTYEKEKDPLDFSSVDENQIYAEALPINFNGEMFMLDDVIYNIPDKASRLIENGWKPIDDLEFIGDDANEKSIITFQKGDQVIQVELRNPTIEPALIRDSYIVSVAFDLDTCQDFSFSGEFDATSTLLDFKILEDQFQVKEVHFDIQGDALVAYRIKTGESAQFEVLMNYEDNTKINGFRITSYPK